MHINRLLKQRIIHILNKGKSILLLGPRQTGKTTLLNEIIAEKRFTLSNPAERLRYEKDPSLLTAEVEQLAKTCLLDSEKKPLVIIDEIQKIPILMDAVQDLIDRKIAQFILTGSSARKLRRHNDMNLVPGRVIPLRLDPLTQEELRGLEYPLEDILLDGTLPEIVLEKEAIEREILLEAYVTIYLEEEVRAEALARDLGSFARFLELAASESGNIINLSKLSKEIGVAHTSIANYYQILEDCLIIERIEPIIFTKTRRRLSKMPKYLFYDLGVRRVAAREGRRPPREEWGRLFEHYVGLELIRLIRLNQKRFPLRYWRDSSGIEVDWVIETTDGYLPIEVKWTDTPSYQDAKHLTLFLQDYPTTRRGIIICRTPHPLKIADNIEALPWDDLEKIVNQL